MNVGSISVSSPPDSYNVLLLNYAGYGTPLRAGAITVDTNAVLTVLGSMLSVTNSGTTNDELLVAGTVNQGDNSAVRATYLYLGPNQPNLAQVGVGTYNLTNGLLNVSTGYMKVSGTLNQYGGYSWFDQLTLYIGGYYYLYDGDFGGNVFIDGGNFYQFGGLFNAGSVMKGFYTLAGGMFISTGGLVVPRVADKVAYFAQSGGTNQSPSLNLGAHAGVGSYTMSGGTLMTPYIKLDFNGTFEHTGGEILNNQRITMVSGKWEAKPGRTQLGQLELPEATRSPILSMPSSCCTFGFAPSANVAWQSGTTLQIKNWAGSLSGGGMHQITFSPNGLTAQQVGQMRFENPAGLPAGTYAARMLASGEIVP